MNTIDLAQGSDLFSRQLSSLSNIMSVSDYLRVVFSYVLDMPNICSSTAIPSCPSKIIDELRSLYHMRRFACSLASQDRVLIKEACSTGSLVLGVLTDNNSGRLLIPTNQFETTDHNLSYHFTQAICRLPDRVITASSKRRIKDQANWLPPLFLRYLTGLEFHLDGSSRIDFFLSFMRWNGIDVPLPTINNNHLEVIDKLISRHTKLGSISILPAWLEFDTDGNGFPGCSVFLALLNNERFSYETVELLQFLIDLRLPIPAIRSMLNLSHCLPGGTGIVQFGAMLSRGNKFKLVTDQVNKEEIHRLLISLNCPFNSVVFEAAISSAIRNRLPVAMSFDVHENGSLAISLEFYFGCLRTLEFYPESFISFCADLESIIDFEHTIIPYLLSNSFFVFGPCFSVGVNLFDHLKVSLDPSNPTVKAYTLQSGGHMMDHPDRGCTNS